MGRAYNPFSLLLGSVFEVHTKQHILPELTLLRRDQKGMLRLRVQFLL
jgi:hypothetical protein